MSTDLRKHPRVSVEVAGEVELGGEMVGVSTQNLSRGGVALVLDRAIAEGTEISLTLFLTQDGIEDPDEEPFESKAVVRWVAESDQQLTIAGVQFSAPTEAQLAALDRFLAAL
ncbi:MAG: PilZ domain-containing protein [Myxococcota bacterium]